MRLEVDLLASGFSVPPIGSDTQPADEREHRTVLVLARDPDLRRYVRECLNGEGALRLLEASSLESALHIAATQSVHLLITDAVEQGVIASLPDVPAIVAAEALRPDGTTLDASAAPRVVLPAPFSSQSLVQQVRRLLG